MFLTIGVPADSLYLTVSPPGGPYCAGAVVTFNTNPDDQYSPYNSTYTWWYNPIGHASYEWTNFAGSIALVVSADTFLMSCQENSYGCLGPKVTLPDTIRVIGKPNITKTGPLKICLGDTGTFSVPFADNTDYKWEVSGPANYDTANNILKVSYTGLGTFRISVVVLNACFADSAVWTVKSDSCNPASISTISANQNVSVYPNPSTGQFTFTFTGGNYSGSKLEVYNILGEMVRDQEISNKKTLIDLVSNPNGIYYYRIIGRTGNETACGKLIIQQ